MSKLHVLFAGFVFAVFLTGCFVPSPEKMTMPNYSIGPVAADAFTGFVEDAIPSNKGKIHVFGYAAWHGFFDSSKSLHFTSPYFSGVAALTDIDILLLMWNEDAQRYEIVAEVPYSEIRFQPRGEWGSTGSLAILMGESEISIGEQPFTSLKKTYLEFLLPSGRRIDREKNRHAHLLFEEKVEQFIPDYSANTPVEDY